MSLTRLPAELRRRAASHAASTAAPLPQRRHASILFALSALSNSRETQHFSKASKLSRVEHSPALKLIQSSEVDPFAKRDATTREVSGVSDGKEKEEEGAVEGATEGMHTTIAAPAASSNTAPVQASLADGTPPASGSSGSDGDGNEPPESGEAAIDEGEALDLGRAMLGRHVQDKRKLRQELRDVRAELKEAREKITKLETEATEEGKKRGRESEADTTLSVPAIAALLLVALVVVNTIGLHSDRGTSPAQVRPAAEAQKLQQELAEAQAQVPSPEEQALNVRNAARAAEVDAVEHQCHALKLELMTETQRLEAKAKKDLAALKAAKDTETATLVLEREAVHDARRAEWARKAEALIAAVEKTDAGRLSKAERDAYLKALVFLRVTEMPERRWWKGLFWRQE